MSFRHFRLRRPDILDGGVLGMNVTNHCLESPSELCTFERITEPVARYRRSVSGMGPKWLWEEDAKRACEDAKLEET